MKGLTFAAALFVVVAVGCGDTVGTTTTTTMGSGIQDTGATSVPTTTVAPTTTIASTTTVVQQIEELIPFPLDTLNFSAEPKDDVRAGGVVADGILYLLLRLPIHGPPPEFQDSLLPLELLDDSMCLAVALVTTDSTGDLFYAQAGNACFEEGVDALEISLIHEATVIIDIGPTPNQGFGLFFELSVEDASGSLDLSASRVSTTPEGVDLSSQLVDATCCDELRIKLWDTGDLYDSIVLLDNFQWSVDSSDPGTVID